jgi:hypothetical protein
MWFQRLLAFISITAIISKKIQSLPLGNRSNVGCRNVVSHPMFIVIILLAGSLLS